MILAELVVVAGQDRVQNDAHDSADCQTGQGDSNIADDELQRAVYRVDGISAQSAREVDAQSQAQ